MSLLAGLVLGIAGALLARRVLKGRRLKPATVEGPGSADPVSGLVGEEACRHAADAAVLAPEAAIGADGPLERFVRGRHASRQEEISARTAERIAVLEGEIAAEESDAAAARAASERARAVWLEERRTLDAVKGRVDAARSALAASRAQRNALPLRARGYVGTSMKWVLVLGVALAVMPLVYLSMEFLDNPVTQIIVVAAAGAALFAAEHALGFAMAHGAQHVSRRVGLLGLFAAAVVIAGCVVGAEWYAGALRGEVGRNAGAGAFDAAAAVSGRVAEQSDFVSMMWTVPLGIGATIAGSLIVALYILGGPGRELRARIKDGKRDLAAALKEHSAAEPRCLDGRKRYEEAQTAADAIAGRTDRAKAEIRGAKHAEAHARAGEEGATLSNLAAAEIAYHAERERRADRGRERAAEQARTAQRDEQDNEHRTRREAREEQQHRERAAREAADRRQRLTREHADRALREQRRKWRRAARRQRRAQRLARLGRAARAAAGTAPDGVRLGGPAATAALLVAGLGGPVLLAAAAGSAGLTAAHLLTRGRRAAAIPSPGWIAVEPGGSNGAAHPNVTSTIGSPKEPS